VLWNKCLYITVVVVFVFLMTSTVNLSINNIWANTV